MYNQPLICIAAFNRIIRNRQIMERRGFVIVDGHEDEWQVLQDLLYICKALWLRDHETCEMIPENFVTSWAGPQVPGLAACFPGWKWQKRWPKFYMESRQLTEEECTLIDRVCLVYSQTHSQSALFEYVLREAGLRHQMQKSGLHVITADMMKLFLSNAKNRQELELFALWGLNPKWKELALWGSRKIIF